MNYRWPFLAAALVVSTGAAISAVLIAYVLAVDIQSDNDTLNEKS